MTWHEPSAGLRRASSERQPEVGGRTGVTRTLTVLPCTAVLFDCDGVLVDSDAAVVRSWTRWALAMDLDPEEVLPAVYGRRSVDTVAEFIALPRRREALELIDRLEIEDAATTTPIPGAAGLVAAIPPHRWATVTSASRDLAHARLKAAGLGAPDVLVTAGDVEHGKPHPEGYLTAAQHLGVPAEQCVVVEDAPAGIRAARAAGVRHVLGVGNREMGEHRPDAVVPDLRSVRWGGVGLEIL